MFKPTAKKTRNQFGTDKMHTQQKLKFLFLFSLSVIINFA